MTSHQQSGRLRVSPWGPWVSAQASGESPTQPPRKKSIRVHHTLCLAFYKPDLQSLHNQGDASVGPHRQGREHRHQPQARS